MPRPARADPQPVQLDEFTRKLLHADREGVRGDSADLGAVRADLGAVSAAHSAGQRVELDPPAVHSVAKLAIGTFATMVGLGRQ